MSAPSHGHNPLDILADVADHEKPLQLKSPSSTGPPGTGALHSADGDAGSGAVQLSNPENASALTQSQSATHLYPEDDDEMALFSAEPPRMAHGFETPPNAEEMDAIFADMQPGLSESLTIDPSHAELLADLDALESSQPGDHDVFADDSGLNSQDGQEGATSSPKPTIAREPPAAALVQIKAEPEESRGSTALPPSSSASHRPTSYVPPANISTPAANPIAAQGNPTRPPTHSRAQAPAYVSTANPTPTPHAANPAQVIEGLLKQVPVEKHNEFRNLYAQLQNKQLSADEFTARAKDMLSLPASAPSAGRPPFGMRSSPLVSSTSNHPSAGSAFRQQQYPPNFGKPTSQHNRIPSGSYRSNTQTLPPQHLRQMQGTPMSGPSRNGQDIEGRVDVTDMMDVTSYAGVNMREEEDNITNSFMTGAPLYQHHLAGGASRLKDQSFLNIAGLKKKVDAIARAADVPEVDQDLLPYLALAAQERMRDLLQRMVQAAKHRTGALHERFLRNERELLAKGEEALELQVVTRGDPRKALAGIEKRERNQELRLRAAKEAAMGMGADGGVGVGGGGDGDNPGGGDDSAVQKAKKRKTVRDKDLPEHIRLERANAALSQAIGGGYIKSWMVAGAGAGSAGSTPGATPGGLKVVPSRKRKSDGGDGQSSGLSGTYSGVRLPGSGRRGAGGTEPAARKVILKDALFCLEGEHAMAKSLVTYKWWANVT
ncbi:Transcription initiation factor TFIID subunit 4B [Geranomyces michiganensis]|nr:Transcription initiation factor TFIID subunit 4B [Geranomyces michiganensis]